MTRIHRAMRVTTVMSVVAFSLASRATGQTGTLPEPVGHRVHTVGDTLVGNVGGVAVDRLGFIYVADFAETVYKISPDGRAEVFVKGLYGASGNAIDAAGTLYQSSFYANHITRIDRHGNQEIVATGLDGPVGIASVGEDLFVCNCLANTIARVTPDGVVTTFAADPLLSCPNGITPAPDGNLYVVNFNDERMLRVSPEGRVDDFATLPGTGNGHVTFARGSLYATSFKGHRLYRVSLAGDVTHIAGTGALGERDGPGLEATFTFPNGIATNRRGDRLYINDKINATPLNIAVPTTPLNTLRVVMLAPLVDRLVVALRDEGIEGLRRTHQELMSDPATRLPEGDLNGLGYQLLGGGAPEAAMAVFTLNAEAYPNSWNVWDSLAESHMVAGNAAKAIEFYERSIELNPANTNAVEQIRLIRGGSQSTE